MLTHKGTQMIETDRLILRKAVIEDAPAMYRNWASDPEVTRFLTWPPHETVDVSRKVLQSWIDEYENDNYYQWMIVSKEMKEPVGSISGMSPNDVLASVEIGYCIGRKWWHMGIMTEALQAVIRYLFEICGFQRITARHDPNNPHSGNVMQKCGMKFEGIFRQADRNNQGICDAVQYAVLLSDYRKPRHFMEGFSADDDADVVREVHRRSEEADMVSALEVNMMRFNRNDPKRIHHFMKVHRFAEMIGHMEKLDQHTQFLVECAALIHDIGIRPAEEKYGRCDGKIQEQEGPSHARRMLQEMRFDEKDTERICYLVGHHHTYTGIEGMDYQILVEADFLVNFYEDQMEQETIRKVYDRVFRTESGKKLCRMVYFGRQTM